MHKFILFFFLLFGVNGLFASDALLSEFISNLLKYNSSIKQLRSANSMQKSILSTPLGKYDLVLNASISRYDQDGGITGNSILVNTKSNDYSIELAKQWSFGLMTSVSHTYYGRTSTYAFPGVPPDTYSPINTVSASLSLLNNFLGTNSRKELKQIEDKIKNTDIDYEEQKKQIIISYISMLFDVKILKESVNLSKAMYKSALSLQRVSNRKYKIGSVEKRQKISADANVLSSKQDLDASIRLYNKMLEKINVMSGFDASKFVDANISDKEISLLKTRAKMAKSKSNIKKQLERELRIAENDLSIAQNSKLPELNLVGSYSVGGLDTTYGASYKDYSQNGYYVGLEFKWNIFNISKKHILDSKYFYLDSLKEKYKQKIKEIDSDEKTVQDEIDSYFKEYKSSLLTFKKLSVRHNLELKAFNEGRTSMYNVITAQRERVMAGLNIVKLKSDLIKSIYTLFVVKGIEVR